MTARNETRKNVRTCGSRIGGVVIIEGLLTIVDQMKWFPCWEMAFPIHIVFDEWRGVTTVKLGVEDGIDIPGALAILGDDGRVRFLTLARQGVVSRMAEEAGVEDGMNFHGFGEFKFDDQGVLKHPFNWKGSHIVIV